MTDVCNYSLTYTVNGHLNHMSPDDHYQDLKRIIAAATGKARRINVIMPFLYESRQHKRTRRESLDCALALEELDAMGVSNIITFDAHDPRVQNAIPLSGFDSFNPQYQFLKALFREVPDLKADKDHLMIISPDEGAMHRAVYFSNVLGVDMGMFYKRRDYSTVVNGKNPIVAHEFLGDDVTGKDVLIVDDMISSGESMLDVAKQLKERNAGRVFVCTTFGLFTDGFDKFDEYYNKGYISKVITTNLTYLPPELYEKPYFVKADMSKFIALIIDSLNHDVPISSVISPTDAPNAFPSPASYPAASSYPSVTSTGLLSLSGTRTLVSVAPKSDTLICIPASFSSVYTVACSPFEVFPKSFFCNGFIFLCSSISRLSIFF